ncbi:MULTISPECIES: alpha-ribazole phosphatase family protein [Pseudomonas]|uniref:alpha-ribazole phosphatase family protein n=1 Tax=Pseudomonas TaxID=286 RepID=UPI0005EBD4A3|nr:MULTISPECIES: alpha-ribazole phosphatase family protein [Pseudomonas]KJK06292.1 alpha-ribazole phosphatase [Pseudomonas sp. 5]MDD1979492.1 alpha-ribazole phosphatase family protein [Pseudomonas putida]
MIIDLLRHGETELGGGLRGSLDDALTAKGWAQMHAAVAGIQPWDVLVSSPLQRCARFAQSLSEQMGLAVQLEPALQELHFGEWEGRSAADLMLTHEQQLGQFWSDPYGFTPPGGEAVIDFADRVLAAITRLHHQQADKHVLLVTHGGVMRLLLARARGLPREQLLQVEVAHGALCRLEVQADGSLREVR